MGKIGKYDYPELKPEDAIRAIKIIENTFNGHAKNMASLASAWGHKTHKSGGFLQKLADLRKYRLIEGRGEVKLNDLSQRLLRPKDSREKKQAFKEMFENISLLKVIKSRLGSRVPDDKFWIILQEITDVDRKKAQEESVKIRKLYNQMLSYVSNVETANYTPQISETSDEMIYQQEQQASTFRSNFTYLDNPDQVIIRFKPSNLHFEMAKNVLEELKTKYEKQANVEKATISKIKNIEEEKDASPKESTLTKPAMSKKEFKVKKETID